jgi:hypothetical protein
MRKEAELIGTTAAGTEYGESARIPSYADLDYTYNPAASVKLNLFFETGHRYYWIPDTNDCGTIAPCTNLARGCSRQSAGRS